MMISRQYLEFHSIFCLGLSRRKPGLTLEEIQGLTLWNNHWKVKKLTSAMSRMIWLKASMASLPNCKGGQKR